MATSSSRTTSPEPRPAGRLLAGLAWFRSLYSSLTWRLVILLGALVIVAQISTWVAWRLLEFEQFAGRIAERVSSQVRLATVLVRSTGSVAELRELAASVERPSLRILVDPWAPPVESNDPALSELRDRIRAALPEGGELRVHTANGHPEAAIRLPVELAEVWLWTLLPPRDGGAEFPPAARVILIGTLVLFGAAVIVWLVSRPLARFDRALGSSQPQMPTLAIPDGCPLELRRLAETINRQIAERNDRERERMQLLAGVSHDLRAPLARMRMRSELVDDAPTRQALVRDVRALDRIAGQFLAFVGGQDAGGGTLAPTRVGARVAEVVDGYRDQGADVACEIADGVEDVTADGTAIERIVANLVDNALVHGLAPVRVRFWRDGGQGVIEVRDKGTGLDQSRFMQARQPFVRLDPARGRAGGCGLGLAIVDRLVAGMGGRVAVANTDDGFTVSVRWPLRAANESEHEGTA
ncbi:MAG: ATP-binding protein [Burkholderiaceae bacterium]